jgi:dihydrodipicolinate synthase/N-acetylneuraminate lyase
LEFYVACEKFLLKELGVIKSDTVRKPGVTLTDFEKEELKNLYKRLN